MKTPNGHLACPPSRRGHAWRELPCKIPPSENGPTIRELIETRVCRCCGEIGRVNSQGIVVTTGRRVDPKAVL
jgi:hypothetical protein